MPSLIRLSRFVYSRLLIFYPPEIRRNFGAEMVDLFEDLLREIPPRCKAAGIVSVWRVALCELASAGLVSRLQSTALIAAAASILLSSLLAWFFFRSVGA